MFLEEVALGFLVWGMLLFLNVTQLSITLLPKEPSLLVGNLRSNLNMSSP